MATADHIHPLHAALDGDRAAWEQIVSEYNRLLWWIARSHRLDQAAAADVVQTTWLALIRFGKDIQDPSRLGAWLATTARRSALQQTSRTATQRSRQSTPLGDLDDMSDLFAPAVDERLLDEERLGAVLAAFRRLSVEEQTLLKLCCAVPKLSYAEIGDRLGKDHGWIGPTRQRALKKLRGFLDEMGMACHDE